MPKSISPSAAPSRAVRAPRSIRQRATAGENQTRAVRGVRRPTRCRSPPAARTSRRAAVRCASGRAGSSAAHRASRSHAWTYQFGSSRSNGTARSRASRSSSRPRFRYSISTSRRACDRLGERPDQLPPPRRRSAARASAQLELPECLLELAPHPVERRVRAGGDHRPDELEREADRPRLERRQARRRVGTRRRRAPSRRGPGRRRARRRPRSSRRRS